MEDKGRHFLEEIGVKASGDEAFRKSLLENPVKVVETRLKAKLPKNLKITVLEEKPDEIFIVIPHQSDKELSDAELESVAGSGICWKNPSCVHYSSCVCAPTG